MSLAEEDNAQVIAELQRRQAFQAMIFYGGLVAIPLGVICPCGLAAVVHQVAPDWSQDVALSSFFLPLVGLAAALLMVGGRSRAKRSLALAHMGDALGLRLTLQPSRNRLGFLTSFPLLKQYQMGLPLPGSGANLMEGNYKGRPLIAVDYTTLHHVPNVRPIVRSQTVAVFTQGFEALPSFAIVPPMFLSRFGQFLMGEIADAFKLPGEKEFNRNFTTVGEDQDRIRSCLTPELMDLLLEDERTFMEVHEGKLAVAYRFTVVSAKDYEDFLRRANRIAKMVEKAGE